MEVKFVVLDPFFGANVQKGFSPAFPDGFHNEGYKGQKKFMAWVWTRQVAVKIQSMLNSSVKTYVMSDIVGDKYSDDAGDAAKLEFIQKLGTGGIYIGVACNSSAAGEWSQHSGWEVCVSSSNNSTQLSNCFINAFTNSSLSANFSLRKGTAGAGAMIKDNVLMLSSVGMPAVVTNNLFYNNLTDVDYLMSQESVDVIANLHVNAVKEYMNAGSAINDTSSASSAVETPAVISQPVTEAVQNKTVWEDTKKNTYAQVGQSTQNAETETEHTRIYEKFPPTIQLDEMSMPLDGMFNGNQENVSTGMAADTSSNIQGKNYTTVGNNGVDATLSIGFTYPLIRINDNYYTHNSIVQFSVESAGFLPKMQLMLKTIDNTVLKREMVKDGDICSVFINGGHGYIKSYRADFIITKTVVFDRDRMSSPVELYLEGELYIPKMYDSELTYSFTGTSSAAIEDAAKRLGLGFNFSDPEPTKDTQIWHCTAGHQKKGESPVMAFIKDTALHAWKEFESFYDCWVDLRYGLSFINIAQMLGGKGLDEEIDLAFYNHAVSLGRGQSGENASQTDEEKRRNPRMQAKILSNIGQEDDAMTAFYVTSVQVVNKGGDITKQLGLSVKNYYNIKNSGLGDSGSDIELNYSIPTNEDKLQNGFYILSGPGTNTTYASGDNGSYVEQHSTKKVGTVQSVMSDSDTEKLKTEGNMKSSGNHNKFFAVGEGHNILNNKWLEKKVVKMTLNGCNMQVMRGEKIPALIVDEMNGLSPLGLNERNYVTKRVMEDYSGWFIIKRLKWVYDTTKEPLNGTLWRTELTLTRREWPIIGYNKNNIDRSEIIVTNNLDGSNYKNAVMDLSSAFNEETVESASQEATTTEGLKPYMVTIYNDVSVAMSSNNKSCILTSGRRWIVDSSGNKTTDKSKAVYENGTYKFVNASGKVLYFASLDSPHLTGDAIDIINGEGTAFNDIIKIISQDKLTLKDMFENDVYCAVETGKDDLGQTIKHYHLAKVDKNDNQSYSGYKAWWEVVVKQIGNTFTYDSKTYNIQDKLVEKINDNTNMDVKVTDVGLSEAMFNQICKYETGKSFGYKMQPKDLNGYDLGDAGGHLTYGYGLLYHPDTNKYMDQVKAVYTQAELETLYKKSAQKFVNGVKKWAASKNLTLSQYKIDAMVCASYNFGLGFLQKNVCKLIAANPNNPQIHYEWEHLSDKQGAKYPGLITRRKFEADWYIKG